MCSNVCIKGEWCETVGELRRAVPGATLVKEPCYKELPDDSFCLCGIDIPATLKTAGLDCTQAECGDYHA
jgi:hypothetical protein